ncbi:MAG: PulJ/GspJ family protein [Puniceicoccales bacterium]
MSPRKLLRSAGFTLIEILAATGIMAVVILVALSLTTNVLTAWNTGAGKLTSNYEARIALDLLARDLESLVIRNRQMNWLYVQWDKPEIPGRISQYNDALPYMPQIYFLAPVADRPRFDSAGNAIPGDVCAVSYQVAYQNPFTGSRADDFPAPMFALYRFVVDAENTFNEVMDPLGFDIGDTSSWLNQRMQGVPYVDEGGANATTAGNIEDTVLTAENFLSANVVDFNMEFYFSDSTDPTAQPQRFPATRPTNNGTIHIADTVYIGNTARSELSLEYIDITITVMSDEGLGIIESGSVGTNQWFDLVAQYGHTYSRRVQVMAKPL